MSKQFNSAERAAIYSVIHERRDMRHFSGGAVEAKVLARILDAAHAAPSVGFMQPWRFARITKLELREQLIALVENLYPINHKDTNLRCLFTFVSLWFAFV